jgi:LPS sulfotransferase NodH
MTSISSLRYVICATPRSGSTLLCSGLASTALAGDPDEFFNPRKLFLRLQTFNLSVGSLEDYVAGLIERTASPNGGFGVKLMWEDLSNFLDDNLGEFPDYAPLQTVDRLAKLFNQPKYIFVTRRDKVRQAISLRKAYETDIWKMPRDKSLTSDNGTPQDELRFDFYRVRKLMHGIDHDEWEWMRFFKRSKIEPLTVVYEDFVANFDKTIRTTLSHIGVEVGADFEVPPMRLNKQADAVSDAWYAQYMAIDRSPLSRLYYDALTPGVRRRLSKIVGRG